MTTDGVRHAWVSGGSGLLDPVRWQRRLEERHREVGTVPGAVLAILYNDEVRTFATGHANLLTGVEVTPDTLFPIGSVTKLYTAALIMQLVDEGELDLDVPIRRYLPAFRVEDDEATERLTTRQLLTHTGGIDGDKFDSYGRGDDALERYVDDCRTLGQVHPAGATFSYCNSGYVILGRLVEVMRGMTWDEAVRTRLLTPLGATRTGTLPEDVIWFRLAAGHQTGDDGVPEPLGMWENDRALGPAGGVIATAEDLLRFVRMQLHNGLAQDGERVLSADSVEAMRSPQVELPDPHSGVTHWGLGWELVRRTARVTLCGHDGDLLGHHAHLTVAPTAGLAVVLLTNGDGADRIADPLFRELMAEVDITLPDPPQPPRTPPATDVAQWAGTYETIALRGRFVAGPQRLDGTFTVTAERIAQLLPESQRERHVVFWPVTESRFVTRDDDEEDWTSALFYESDGRRYLHTGLRVLCRTDAA